MPLRNFYTYYDLFYTFLEYPNTTVAIWRFSTYYIWYKSTDSTGTVQNYVEIM